MLTTRLYVPADIYKKSSIDLYNSQVQLTAMYKGSSRTAYTTLPPLAGLDLG